MAAPNPRIQAKEFELQAIFSGESDLLGRLLRPQYTRVCEMTWVGREWKPGSAEKTVASERWWPRLALEAGAGLGSQDVRGGEGQPAC